jgi:precorrin-6x reductase
VYKIIAFGGTTEGRKLYEFLRERAVPALTCVATEYGAQQLSGPGVMTGRLGKAEMRELIGYHRPALVIDATHPYAVDASANVKSACRDEGAEYLRVLRDSSEAGGAFPSLDGLISRLAAAEGQAFVTLGVNHARALTALPDYKERLWLRILPSVDGLGQCLRLGYPAKRIICMQGPFSKELNLAMFKASGAKILVTKESGGAGGFKEKMEAAWESGMDSFVLGRPADNGVSLNKALERNSAL